MFLLSRSLTRPQKVKQPKPEKQSSWRKNPTALDIEENNRLRLLLDQEKTTNIVCDELTGDIRVRAGDDHITLS